MCCVRLGALYKVSNTKSQKLLRGLGFQEEGRLRKFFNPEDGIVFGQLLFRMQMDIELVMGKSSPALPPDYTAEKREIREATEADYATRAADYNTAVNNYNTALSGYQSSA